MGIDASRRQMAAGQEILNQLPGKNVRLECRDILEITPEFGQFDYIICHGVFSWVPRNVQDHILAICQLNLSPTGIAYVSYNTYPGWRMRGTIRDMMVFHTRRYESPQDRVGHSRALLDFLVKTVPEENNAYGRFLRSEMDLLRDKADYYLLHEHLEVVNEPIYFHEFAERAANHKLQYIAEAEWGEVLAAREALPAAIGRFAASHAKGPKFADPLKGWGDALARQGQWKAALAKYDEALRLAPAWAALRQARETALRRVT